MTWVKVWKTLFTGRQADRQTGRQADRQTGRQADRQTGRQADRQTERSSPIELLRIFAGMSVVILHFNFGGVGAVENTSGITQHILLLFEAICNCAVNVFLLISGYCSAYSRKINVSRLLQLIIQTSIFSLLFRIVASMINDNWSLKIFASLLPVNYYVILYVTLMLVAPFINIALGRLSRESLKLFLIISVMAFSIYPTAVDVLEECTGKQFMGLNSVSVNGSIAGYSIINFILIYVIGAAIRLFDLIGHIQKKGLLALWVVSVSGIYVWHLFLPKTGYIYCNPLVVLEATATFLLIAGLNFKSRTVNYIAPAAFTCYLIHTSVLKIVGKHIVASSSSIRMLFMLFSMVVGVYLLSFAMMKLWYWWVKPLYRISLDKIPVVRVREV